MENADPAYRDLQIRILATFFTPADIWFAPSGRVGVKDIIRIRHDTPIGIHFVDPETLPIENLNDEVQFIQEVLRGIIDFFQKIASKPTDSLVKKLLEKIADNPKANELVELLKQWLKNMKP